MISDYYNTFKDPDKEDSFLKRAADGAASYSPLSAIATAAAYDTKKLTDFAKQLARENGVIDQAADERARRADLKKDADEKGEIDNEIDKLKISSRSSSSNILAMIFKIVPIGLNVISRLPTLAQGMGETIEGTATGIVGLGTTSFQLFMDTYRFIFQAFIFTFVAIMCSFENLSQLNKCFLFYLVDIFILIVFVFIMSFLFLFDVVFFPVKKATGVGFVDMFLMMLDMFEAIDQSIYGWLGFHIFHYPDSITRMCYTCSHKYNTPALKTTFGKLKYNVGTLLPKNLGPPFKKLKSGGSKIMQVFKM